MADELNVTAVQAALKTRWLGRPYHYLAAVGSTNVALKEMAATGDGSEAPAGTVLLADYQRQGRGRFDRQWDAPPATSLLFSILFRPYWPAGQANWLTMMASLAVAEAIEAVTALDVGIKWPNDLVVALDGTWHKVGGLLLEGSMGPRGLESVILGIGLNVNIPREELPRETMMPATSLLLASGRKIARLPLFVNLLHRLEIYYETAEHAQQSPQPAWNRRLITLGQNVKVTNAGDGRSLSGLAESTDTWGQLLIRDSLGRLHTIAAGDVTLKHSQA
jgi:BirA family biotin operon repressor/biotin-[acetyl-CoA-carboxylase] ligase